MHWIGTYISGWPDIRSGFPFFFLLSDGYSAGQKRYPAKYVAGHKPLTTGYPAKYAAGHKPLTTGYPAKYVAGHKPLTTGYPAKYVAGHKPLTTGYPVHLPDFRHNGIRPARYPA